MGRRASMSAVRLPPSASPLHRPQREPADEAVEEEVVEEGDGDGDQCRHEGLPEEHVPGTEQVHGISVYPLR
jgi:hypothetical protein